MQIKRYKSYEKNHPTLRAVKRFYLLPGNFWQQKLPNRFLMTPKITKLNDSGKTYPSSKL
jgi:hypothetical protein